MSRYNTTCLCFVISPQLLQVVLGLLAGSFRSFSLLREHVALVRRKVNLSLLRIDLRRPGLQFLLLNLDLVVEDLRLVYSPSQ